MGSREVYKNFSTAFITDRNLLKRFFPLKKMKSDIYNRTLTIL